MYSSQAFHYTKCFNFFIIIFIITIAIFVEVLFYLYLLLLCYCNYYCLNLFLRWKTKKRTHTHKQMFIFFSITTSFNCHYHHIISKSLFNFITFSFYLFFNDQWILILIFFYPFYFLSLNHISSSFYFPTFYFFV